MTNYRSDWDSYAVVPVECGRCGVFGNASSLDEGWLTDEDGEWLCWFCQQDVDEPLPIVLTEAVSVPDGASLHCLSSSTYLNSDPKNVSRETIQPPEGEEEDE